MPVSNDSLPSMEDPLALIRFRIKEKRLFEARFLYRQLGDALSPEERASLKHELSLLVQQVEHLHQQARAFLAAGQHEQAALLLQEMEMIAIDIPGLADDKRVLEGATALAAKITSRAVAAEPEPLILPPPVSAPEERSPLFVSEDLMLEEDFVFDEEEEIAVAAFVPASHRPKKKGAKALVLVLSLAGIVAVLAVLLSLWLGDTDAPPVAVAPSFPLEQNVRIRPLVAESPAVIPPFTKVQLPVELVLPPPTTLQLGGLQIEESWENNPE